MDLYKDFPMRFERHDAGVLEVKEGVASHRERRKPHFG